MQRQYNHDAMKLSVVIPVFNEVDNIKEILKRVRASRLASEIIVVDDCSQDGTRAVLQQLDGKGGVCLILHDTNRGKGAAVRTGLAKARGDVILIQDADLEYSPHDYPMLLQPIQDGIADVVYGSRFLGGPRRAVMFWHMIANKMLTFMTNILYDAILSDMETGYKAFRANIIQNSPLRSRRFDFEPEITAKVLKRGNRIYEVPISYFGREYAEGKKIGFKDGFVASWTLLKYRFVD